jgi:hypothetical protein
VARVSPARSLLGFRRVSAETSSAVSVSQSGASETVVARQSRLDILRVGALRSRGKGRPNRRRGRSPAWPADAVRTRCASPISGLRARLVDVQSDIPRCAARAAACASRGEAELRLDWRAASCGSVGRDAVCARGGVPLRRPGRPQPGRRGQRRGRSRRSPSVARRPRRFSSRASSRSSLSPTSRNIRSTAAPSPRVISAMARTSPVNPRTRAAQIGPATTSAAADPNARTRGRGATAPRYRFE